MHPNFPFLGQPISVMLMAFGSQTHHIEFEKHEKTLGKERGIHDGTIFKVHRSFYLYIWLFTEP
jgi:hypothetical protein